MGLSYKKAGVDIDKGEEFVRAIKPLVKNTKTKYSMGQIGGFGGLLRFPSGDFKNPVMVSSTDGVGTKLKIAFLLDKHDTVGIDLVAMNVNDIVVCGAMPLLFLDYIACGKIDVGVLRDVVKGIVEGCRQAGCALVGGETAEMPAFYKKDEYDLAGFSTGVVEKGKMIDSSKIKKGDVLVGIASSGLHSNGFSLARKVFSEKELKTSVGKILLTPTRIYVNVVLDLVEKVEVKGLAHITGGAFYEKLPRVIPKGLCALVNKKSWDIPDIFETMRKKAKISDREMFRTFNMGIGMVAVVSKNQVDRCTSVIKKHGYKSWVIGEIIKADDRVRFTEFGF